MINRFLAIINLCLCAILLNTALSLSPLSAQESRISIRGTNLEIPRFITLKTNKVNMRSGPGYEYPIKWQYQRKGLPLKVIGEFDVWRKVADHEGTTGWMHVSTISIKRMALIIDTTAAFHLKDNNTSRVIAVAEKGVITELEYCRGDWCSVNADGLTGWVLRQAVWGLLEDEVFN